MMRRRLWLVMTLLMTTATVASAQHYTSNNGFNLAIGLGLGSQGTTCSGNDCSSTTSESGFGASLRVGWSFVPKYVVGIEAVTWNHSASGISPQNGLTESIEQDYTSVGVVGVWYPQRHHEYFFKGGLGIAHVTTQLATESQGQSQVTANPFVVQVGAGFDLNIAKSWSITPFIDYHYGFSTNATASKETQKQPVTTSLVFFGLAVTIP